MAIPVFGGWVVNRSRQTDWLCLHGFTGTPHDWRPVLERVEGVGRVFCPALSGHGVGDGAVSAAEVSPGGSFEAEVDRLAAWLASRTDEPVALAGYSLGGRLALGLLARHPERFLAAVLVGAHAGLRDAELRRQRRAADEALADGLERDGIETFVDHWQGLPLFASQRRLPAAVRAAQRARRLTHDPSGLAGSLRRTGAGTMPDYWGRLVAIEQPVALVVGELDTKFRRCGEQMLASWPSALLEVVPEVGHNVVLEAPGAVAERMTRIVESVSSRALEVFGSVEVFGCSR